jgi:hypothetical protein
MRLNWPMIWSDEPDEAWVDEADLRGRRALEDGVAMMAALGDQRGPWPLPQCTVGDTATNEDADRETA